MYLGSTFDRSDDPKLSENEAAPRLLIVDDDKGMAKVIATTAAGLGYITREVHDPTEAVQSFIDFQPDVLMLDLIMPGKDGVDVLNEVLAIDPAVKLVLISGHGETYLRLGSAVARFHGDRHAETLRKPFRAATLRDLLARLAQT